LYSGSPLEFKRLTVTALSVEVSRLRVEGTSDSDNVNALVDSDPAQITVIV
jgi:hypothetical protein